MRKIGISDIDDDAVSSEESLVIDMVRTKYPKLDLRRGTVLRDLLVSADAAVGAVYSAQAAEQRGSSSLSRLVEREAAGEEIDEADVSAIMSNFNMAPVEGTKARGSVRMSMDRERAYHVAKGSVFRTMDGLEFQATSDVSAVPEPTGADDEVPLNKGIGSGRWFLVPVECSSTGVSGNIGQGTSLEPAFDVFGFVSASAYTAFSGGSDLEPVDKVVSRIRQSLSVRGLLTRSSTEAVIRDDLDGTDNPVVAVSTCGYGSAAQLRDKHNAFGVAVGGRVDVYVRNFTNLPVGHVTKAGVKDGVVYRVSVSADEMPGIYCVNSVSDPESDAMASYSHVESWTDCGSSGTWHDFDVSRGTDELMGTVWRGVDIEIGEANPGSFDEDGNPLFRVSFVRLPEATRIQELLDDRAVRSTGTDYVARCPVIVQVSVNAIVRHKYEVKFSIDEAVAKICEYVNTSGFVGRLTRSEISAVLIGMGATSVDLVDENGMLYGFGYAADGSLFTLSGDSLDVSNVRQGEKGMVAKETCVFVADPRNIVIKAIPE